MMNKGLYQPLKRKYLFKYKRGGDIEMYHIIDTRFYLKLGVSVLYTDNNVMSWEELEIAINHFKFVNKYVR